MISSTLPDHFTGQKNALLRPVGRGLVQQTVFLFIGSDEARLGKELRTISSRVIQRVS